MLQPRNSWRWSCCSQANALVLDMDDSMAFVTAYSIKQLANADIDQQFNLTDAQLYQQVYSLLRESSLHYASSEARCVQIALNATAVSRFYRPMMPKSWFFDQASEERQIAALPSLQPQLCVLINPLQSGVFLQLESNESASICMLVQAEFYLTEHKSMQLFDVIKVMNDRLHQPVFQQARKCG